MEDLTRKFEFIKKKQIKMLDLKNTITAIKNSINGFKRSLATQDQNISKVDEISIQNMQTEV